MRLILLSNTGVVLETWYINSDLDLPDLEELCEAFEDAETQGK